MSLSWMDGFETYGTSGTALPHFGQRYMDLDALPYFDNLEITTGRHAGFAIQSGANVEPAYFRLSEGPFAAGDVTIGFNCQVSDSHKFFSLFELALEDDFDTVTAENLNLRTAADGNIAVYFQNTLLDTTTGIDLSADWHYIEFKARCDDTTGLYELYVDGVLELSDTGLDTQVFTDPGYFVEGRYDFMQFGNEDDDDQDFKFDDLYVTLDDASGLNDGVLGPRFIEAIVATADGDDSEFTPSTGTDHFALVDENPPNDDTDYVSAANSSGFLDLWEYGDLADMGGSLVNALTIHTVGRDDTSSASIRNVWKSNGFQQDESGASSFGTAYSLLYKQVDLNPDGDVQWTKSTVNSAQFGVQEDG